MYCPRITGTMRMFLAYDGVKLAEYRHTRSISSRIYGNLDTRYILKRLSFHAHLLPFPSYQTGCFKLFKPCLGVLVNSFSEGYDVLSFTVDSLPQF